MTQQGAKQSDWTTAEVSYLRCAAGKLPLSEISDNLGRTPGSVKMQAMRMGIASLRCYDQKLVWCVECASMRTFLDPTTGRCRVCTLRAQLKGREDACAEVLRMMGPLQRARYADTEAHRQTRHVPRRPAMRVSVPISHYQRRLAEEYYCRRLEAWEYRCLKLQYDAAKTRLCRMRKKAGVNPRKNLPK